MRVAILAASVAFGAGAAALGLWLGQPAAGTDIAATTSPPVAAMAAGPVSLGPTRLFPLSLELDGADVVFSYELVDEAPPAGPTIFVNPDVPVVAPEHWTMATVSGPIAGTTSTVFATTARFPVAPGFTHDQVGSITLESYRIRLPLEYTVELGWDDTEPVPLDDGVAIGVRRILEQSSSTLVQLAVETPSDGFASAGGAFGAAFESAPRVRGVGPGWTNIGPVSGGVQLTFVGDQLPDPFTVKVTTSTWTQVVRPVTFGVGGLADG